LTALKEYAPTAEALALGESWEKREVPIRVVFEVPMTFEKYIFPPLLEVRLICYFRTFFFTP
jgi:hypothetical protein